MKKYGRSLSLGILLLVFWICPVAAPAADTSATELFNKGASAYQSGNFQAAEQYYIKILNSGIANASVYYNLGNVFFKQKRMGEAVYYWEKARQLLPNDRDIRENLELANLLLVDRIEAPEDPLPVKILGKITGLLTISQESTILLILFFVANILFFVYLRTGNSRSAYRMLLGCFATGLLFLIVAGSLSWKVYHNSYIKEGIVVEQKVDVRSGPGSENITVFTIHEGIKVRVHQTGNGWHQISLPNGWSGWLPQNNLRML
jgi:tetratricopeptide (TPR) repeat protein